MQFFSELEKEHLESLKKNLRSPQDYFFHRYKNFSDFKEINQDMCLWQWYYVQSSCSLLINTFTYLAKTFYSLLNVQFSIAGDHFTATGNAVGSAFVKLSLAIGLLCLQLVRFLSLFIATFFPELAYSACFISGFAIANVTLPILGMAGLYLGLSISILSLTLLISPNLANLITYLEGVDPRIVEANTQRDDVNRCCALLDEVVVERKQIIFRLQQLSDASSVNSSQANQVYSYSLFYEKIPIEIKHERIEINELVNRLLISLKQYPIFSCERANNDPNYYSELHDELNERHTIVKMLAEEYFRRVDRVELLKKDLNTSI